jgi:hypothetical protein
VAINSSDDPSRGTGDDKVTGAAPKGFDAPPDAFDNEPADSNAADPARGGCLKLGWGCLPVLLIVMTSAGLLL